MYSVKFVSFRKRMRSSGGDDDDDVAGIPFESFLLSTPPLVVLKFLRTHMKFFSLF